MKGTNFQAAAFSVSELKAGTTQAECLKAEEPPPHVGRARRETVNGVTFTVIEIDGVATGNLIDDYVYRSFHRDKCYELDVRIAFSNPANADPGTMKNFDLAVVHHRLKQCWTRSSSSNNHVLVYGLPVCLDNVWRNQPLHSEPLGYEYTIYNHQRSSPIPSITL
jgi:hypothetical protein